MMGAFFFGAGLGVDKWNYYFCKKTNAKKKKFVKEPGDEKERGYQRAEDICVIEREVGGHKK
jgi:hypothetical protein